MKTPLSFTLVNILLLSFIFCLPVKASHYYFKQISLKEGLPSTVKNIFTDSNGIVWIGTKNGLARFDGYELQKYRHEQNNPLSLPDDPIVRIVEDKLYNIWILTEKGMALYMPDTDNFVTMKDKNGSNIIAHSVCEQPDGMLFGCRNQIYKYDYQTRELSLSLNFNYRDGYPILSLYVWDKNTYLCSNRWKGLVLVDRHTGKTSPTPFNCGDEIISMLIDSRERIWISPYNQGIRCFDRSGKLLEEYTTANSGLNNNVILCMSERDSQIWAGTDGGGINIIDPEKKEIHILEHISGDNYSLPVNSVLSLYKDNYNNMWAGTIRDGLINIREVYMKTYTHSLLGNENGISDNTVLSLHQEPSGIVWVGTDGGGINKFNPSTEKFKHFSNTWGDKIASITGFSDSELLITIFNRGVFRFNKQTSALNRVLIVNDSIDHSLCHTGKAVNVYRNTPETILFLGNPNIYTYTVSSGHFEEVEKEFDEQITGALLPIHHNPYLTYMNDFYSIYEFNHRTNKLSRIYKCPEDNHINVVSRDQYGTFWIGTNYGLISHNPIIQQSQNIKTSLFSGINSIICDQQDKVWIGADGMVFTYLIKEQKFILFGESDGIQPNEYLNKPRLIGQDGSVYMGGIKGLLAIDKDIPLGTDEIPELRLKDIIINGEPANAEINERQAGISVPWNNKSIVIKVQSQEKDIFRKKIYRYTIKGANDQQIDSYKPELIIRSLPPGNYNLSASCSKKDGDWTSPQSLLSIRVMPPWYKTWWFILSCLIAISGLLAWLFFSAIRKKEYELKWAMKEHEQKVYEEKVRFLINISHELRTPLTLIHAPLKRILQALPETDVHFLPLKSVYHQAQRMKNLINTVLDVRKMEVGENKLQIKKHPLNKWIHSVSEDFITECNEKQIRLVYLLDEEVGEVPFDEHKCEIILTNLLINAVKYSPDNTEIIVSSGRCDDNRKVRITVTDQGCGLKNVDMTKLFTRFYQVNNEQGGSGIGLSYSRILAELHGGRLEAKDRDDQSGAIFFFELPVEQDVISETYQPKPYLNELIAGYEENDNSEKPVSIRTTDNYTLLLAEDNTELINFLKETLRDQFKQIYTATNGKDALQIVKDKQPDILVSDIMMPQMDGYELCKAIKEDIEISHIPVILLTARDDEKSRSLGYKNGADGYLVKPFDMDTLQERIRSLLINREHIKNRYLKAGFIPQPQETTFSNTDEQFLLKLNRVITDNLTNPSLDVPLLCKEIGMSRSSLYNKMKAITNMGIADYINKLRMEKAINLLATTEMNITEITTEVGFSTARYFSTAFKQYTGSTPTQYKENIKNE